MGKMKLLKYRVTNFRSVEDSGWITADDVTALIGINESGKSNLLIPLWKLNPARDGQINILSDMPRKKYNLMREEKDKHTFIQAQFEVTDELKAELAEKYGCKTENFKMVEVSRKYDGQRLVSLASSGIEYDKEKGSEIAGTVCEHIPKFVYYSNYGNLDSDIFLPHVIENMKRNDLTGKEEARARTLKVLFDFVHLDAQEILSLGQADNGNSASLEKKKEREVLLQSASSRLTAEFKDWWKQGNYQFQLRADGNFFKIWVSDEKRPELIELEGRSTGLQWFLSFFLVFLAEADDSHDGCILLLDEPGLTLHALAQKDLASFFENLAENNQLIYSTHSPFLIESDKLDRVRAVYINDQGLTEATTDLRGAAPGSVKSKSIFAAHAALGLSVADALLNGSFPVIVEGPSDQNYMNMIKTKLLTSGLLKTTKEVVFLPGGGAKGIKSIAPIVSGKTDELPFVLLDSDGQGKQMAESLRSGLYQGEKHKIILVGEILGKDNVEVEDLVRSELIAKSFSKLHHSTSAEQDFDETVTADQPIVSQMEAYAKNNGITLPEGWKVDLSREVKRRALLDKTESNPEDLKRWQKLFEKLFILDQTPLKNRLASHKSDSIAAEALTN